ncbi:hypothetical protein GCM10009554_15620 [Kribbella koreensis]|uniref:Uncharacterized protein n=1 Tax=Kribbella koreensis TaxID=57909 RepID=A0ABP4A8D3_9ACTN
MTDPVRTPAPPADEPLSGHHPLTTRPSDPRRGSPPARRSLRSRLLRSIAYGLALVPVSLLTFVRTLLGRSDAVHQTWRELARFQGSPDPIRLRRPGLFSSLLSAVVSLVLGLLSWFLVMLLVTAVVRGPFYGFVEHGPFGPGTWGGPTKAGAWAVHAAISIPIVVSIPFILRGLALLQAASIRRLYGSATSRMVLPATIVLAIAGGAFFYSWTQQL